MEGFKARPSDLVKHGAGRGAEFQRPTKQCPAFAVAFAGIGLRHRSRHRGPVIRKEVEIRPECDEMFRAIEKVVGARA